MSFEGKRVLALESRRAPEIAELIRRQGGEPFVAPSMREVPIEENTALTDFAERLFDGDFAERVDDPFHVVGGNPAAVGQHADSGRGIGDSLDWNQDFQSLNTPRINSCIDRV